MADDPLLRFRDRFPILSDTTYLVSHSLGAMPASVRDELATFTEMWATRGVRSWAEGWWQMPLTVGDELAPLIGASPGTVVMHQNVSVCQSIVLSCLRPTPERNRIVCVEPDFPSVLYVHEAHAHAGGFELRVVGEPGKLASPLEELLAAIDERTLLVPVSHVLFKTGELQDIEAIVQRAHEVGALVLLDTYQSAGTYPVDVTALDVDFAAGGSVKWLCGGPGAGYLYVHPRHHDLEPQVTGWMAHAEPFSFTTELAYASGIARFLHGSPAVPSLFAARAGYRVVAEAGLAAIREKSLRQTSLIIERATEAGLRVVTPAARDARGGMVTIEVADGAAVTAALAERDILIDFRPGAGVRLSPHFYTTDDELEGALEVLTQSAAARAGDGASATALY